MSNIPTKLQLSVDIKSITRYDVFKSISIKEISQFKLSRAYFTGIYETLITLPINNVIIFIGYSEKIGGDAQIGFTGSIDGDNYPLDTACKELNEETGFTTDILNFKLNGEYIEKNNRRIFVYTLKALDCSPLDKIPLGKKSVGFNNKIVVLIHGTSLEVTNLMKKVPIRNGEENIDYFLAVPISDAIQMASHLIKLPRNRIPITWPINETKDKENIQEKLNRDRDRGRDRGRGRYRM